MTQPVYRIAPRSAVAVADIRLLRVARTELPPQASDGGSLIERLRARLGRGGPSDR